ncbi:disulfide bond formation protein DsbG (plasmid) [Burkholderia aenigmatica]|uniref:disulfide bond formation protein DsbG n=1 Tax=Burkholderia aenigmatica TaxID=2015348 RepID=UPI003B43511F
MMRFKHLAVSLIVATASTCALAADLPTAGGGVNAPAGPASALISRLTKGMTSVKTFNTPNGMIGVVAKAPDKQGAARPVMLFVDPEGRMVLYGLGFDLKSNTLLGADVVKTVFGASGANFGAPPAAIQAATAQKSDLVDNKTIARLESSAYIETKGVSAGGSTVYAFVEPNCGWCQRAAPAMMSAQRTPGTPLSSTTIRWIPLAFSDEAAQQGISALSGTGDGRARVAQIFSPAKPFDVQANPTTQKLTQNLALFQQLGDTGTPTFYEQPKGATTARRIEGWGGVEAFGH